jgi:hypothetical protein
MNSPYKFTDPLGLLSVSTGACGQCQNVDRGGGGALTSGGSDNTFSDLFENMALNNAVDLALENLAPYLWGQNLINGEHKIINKAMTTMLTEGTAESKRIAAMIVNNNIAVDVQPQAQLGNNSAMSGVNGSLNATALTKAIAAPGTLTQSQALGYMFITIAREELGNAASVEANIIHEGKHMETYAAVIVSLSTGDPKKYQNETVYDDEVRASTTATEYLKSRGGVHVQYGQILTHLDGNGNVNKAAMQGKGNQAVTNFGTVKNVQEALKASGVSW